MSDSNTNASENASPTNVPAARFGHLQGTPLVSRDWLCFGLVFLAALAFRIVYVVQISASPLFDSPILDAEAHDQWARMIVDGVSAFPGTAYFKAPLYPYFLAFVRIISGDDYWVPRIVQIVMGSISCGLIYLVGREAFNRAVGVVAGLAAAAYWVMIYFDAELLLEPLSIFLTLMSLWLILRAANHDSAWRWVIAGLFMGLSAITRPNVLLFIPVIALWIVWIERARFRIALVRSVAWGVACFLPILPVTIRNFVVGDDFVLIASQAGPNFFIGNNPKADGYTAQIPGARASWVGGFHDWTSMAEQALGRKLKASEVDRFFFDQAKAFIRAEPGRAAGMMFVKAQLFFYEWEIPNDSDLYGMTELYAPMFARLPVTSGAVLALGLVGFLIALGDFKRLLPLTSFVVLYSASVIVFFVCSRFRLPVMPVALVLAAVVPVRLLASVRGKDWRGVAGYSIFIYLAWIGIHRGMNEKVLDKYRAVTHQRVGFTLGSKGLPGEEAAYHRALELDPRCAEAETGLAYFHMRGDRRDSAIIHFQRALAINGELDVHADLGRLLAQAGRWEEAIATVRDGLSRLPGYLDLKRKLAFMLATCPIDRLRDGPEAVRLAEEAASVAMETPETFDTLGAAYAAVGRFDDAIAAAERALDIARRRGVVTAVEPISHRLAEYRKGRPYRQSVGVSE